MTGLVHHYGLVALFIVVMLESGGAPLPGETALVAAAVYASTGHMNIVEVIVVAAIAAIVGDNIGYWLGRTLGRGAFERIPILRNHSAGFLPWSERFFKRHGGKTIFFARFFSVLRVTAAWVAGISRMHWWMFFLWNAAGGICWALLVGLIAYYVGHAAADAIGQYGLIAGAAIVVLVAAALVGLHFWRKRVLRAETES
jgi:membrane protein DedA with SNARE-associated domain